VGWGEEGDQGANIKKHGLHVLTVLCAAPPGNAANLKVLLEANKIKAGIDVIRASFQKETTLAELRADGVIVAKVRRSSWG
jgi:hypothetical protein